jgi:hypothetical protein
MKAFTTSARTGPGIILHFGMGTAAGSSASAAWRASSSNMPKKRSRHTLIRDRCSSFRDSLHFNRGKTFIFLLIFSFATYVRDEGVAGSNPATPTMILFFCLLFTIGG